MAGGIYRAYMSVRGLGLTCGLPVEIAGKEKSMEMLIVLGIKRAAIAMRSSILW